MATSRTTTAPDTINDENTMPRGLLILQGILQILFGLWLISAPGISLVILVQVLGVYWFIVGIIHLAEIFTTHTKSKLWLAISGIVGIIAGLLVLNHPIQGTVITGTLLILLVAWAGIIIGLMNIIRGFQGGGAGSFILGLLSLILGIFLLLNPLGAAIALPLVLGWIILIGGIALIILALSGYGTKNIT